MLQKGKKKLKETLEEKNMAIILKLIPKRELPYFEVNEKISMWNFILIKVKYFEKYKD